MKTLFKHIAIWYLRKIDVQLIMNIHFLTPTKITGTKSKNFSSYDNDGEELSVFPNYTEEVRNE
ncbi:hypothetical protein FEZ48_13360 [Marinilactibacillus psychrotolerans]|uniref:Uncharacterized protein n=1 Tax=Marinilactibacillus psychrotolerans TaxID=191770 RepID=A0A5R9BVK0_9LACT|nr:hypothetical protein [Marinilactibacillus psychrotolerans]TLQ04728.1 hypothetical protein FEZ48_13360 [Marinilactibacillus psychrotolerans]